MTTLEKIRIIEKNLKLSYLQDVLEDIIKSPYPKEIVVEKAEEFSIMSNPKVLEWLKEDSDAISYTNEALISGIPFNDFFDVLKQGRYLQVQDEAFEEFDDIQKMLRYIKEELNEN